MSISVTLERVCKTHGRVVAVNDVSLTVHEGEFFSILGPSGSGKSTLLRLIAGLDVPDQGRIHIQNRDVTQDPPHERSVNMVFQHYALFPHMSVWDNVAFGLMMKKQESGAVRQAVSGMLKLVRLEGLSQRLPDQLSGGEQQRVALARALINRPDVILLDEPMAALDQQLRLEMQQEICRLQQELGATFICVTHHQEDALRMSDRVAVMHEGKILQVGTPQELYDHPVDATVAEFIGCSNVLSGMIVRTEDHHLWVEYEGSQVLVVDRSHHGPRENVVKIMIRPEKLHVTKHQAETGYDNILEAILEQTSFNGNELWCQVRLKHQALWALRIPIQDALAASLAPGDLVYLHWNASEGVLL